MQHPGVLLQVNTNQKFAILTKIVSNPLQQFTRLRRLEVAYT